MRRETIEFQCPPSLLGNVMTATQIEWTTAQLCLARCLKGAGLPSELMEIFLARCGATGEDLTTLVGAGYAERGEERTALTRRGWLEYKRAARGRWF